MVIKLRNGEYIQYKDNDIVGFNPSECYIKVSCEIILLFKIKFNRKVYLDKGWVHANRNKYVTNEEFIINGLNNGFVGENNSNANYSG